MKARLHIQKWTGSAATKPGEEPSGLLNGVLELDGHIVTNGKVTITTAGGDFLTVTADLIVQSLEVVEHSTDTWDALAGQP